MREKPRFATDRRIYIRRGRKTGVGRIALKQLSVSPPFRVSSFRFHQKVSFPSAYLALIVLSNYTYWYFNYQYFNNNFNNTLRRLTEEFLREKPRFATDRRIYIRRGRKTGVGRTALNTQSLRNFISGILLPVSPKSTGQTRDCRGRCEILPRPAAP